MGSNSKDDSSQQLSSLAQRLRLYKPQSLHNPAKPKDGFLQISGSALPQELNSNARPKRAAVLVCIFQGDGGDLRVILTKRSSTLSSHSGEVALPGGKREECDANDVKTALREAKEEIGLDPSLVDVVAVLEPFVTKIGLTVIPVVGILFDKKAFNPVLNADEVESIFDVPLEMFLKDEHRRAEEREWMGSKHLLQFFDYQSGNERYVIWALTAGIMITVASIIYERPPEFLERRPSFWSRIADQDQNSLESSGIVDL